MSDPQESQRQQAVDRRTFLATAAATATVASGLEGILGARRAPAYAQGTRLHWVRWVDFVPASDEELKRQMPEASKALGAEVVLETINANDLQPRITAAIQSGSGADIFIMQYNWPQLYQSALVDVSDVASELAKAEGGFYDIFPPSCEVNGHWLAVPHSILGNAVAYRKSRLKEVGAAHFPKTWDEARKVFSALKKKGAPYGQTLGHTFGDAPTFTYPMMWSFGAAETDRTGKKVVLSSKGAVDSVRFMQAFWKEACDEGALAWDDTNNNRAFLSGDISATLNGASIYIAAKRQKDKIKDEKGEPLYQDIDHAPLPAGPAGGYLLFLNHSHAIMKYSKNQKLAKDFLRWLHKRENYEKWFLTQEAYSVGATKAWEKHPMWATVDEPLKMFRNAANNTRLFGYAGPSTAKATEAFSKYIITDMYARSVQGTSPEDAVRGADAELKKIYEG
ncbi:MAG TPA: extracellular solute-binding protein [Methylomirabilota bacterium]|jgi:multiple sugar transport system substrate-binding protein|nr:extracellular solute-binding protein [Methylomirabilota bacterium]